MDQRHYRQLIFGLILVLAIAGLFLSPPASLSPSSQLASPVAPIKQWKILIVPGHDNEYYGAEFGILQEADLTLLAAASLAAFLNQNPRFAVTVARDLASGDYPSELTRYFRTERQSIRVFRQSSQVSNYTGAPKSFTQDEVALRLHGINQWAEQQRVDLVIHLHFNDYAGRTKDQIGPYAGVAIYVPRAASSSQAVAQTVYNGLKSYFATSNAPAETDGVIIDGALIATSPEVTRRGAAFLLEYGYIYEPKFSHPETRRVILSEMNWQIYRALENYFGSKKDLPETLLLPYRFSRELTATSTGRDVLALERALYQEKLYQCPFGGIFSPCLTDAVKTYQQKYKLPPTGVVGAATLAELNRRYSK